MNLTRRDFIKLSTAAAVSAAVPAGALAADPHTGSRKKGLGLYRRNPELVDLLTALKCQWFYSWSGTPTDSPPSDIPFIPMVRSRNANAGDVARIADKAKEQGTEELLGLNEPDAKKQDDMTVEQALEIWPLLMETGMRLGSPGCVHPDNDWMTQFMAGVKERDLRVDFISVHSYGGPNADGFVKRLTKVHELYERPLWITEFAVGDWKAKSVGEHMHSPEIVLAFMEKVLPMLEDLDFLERYAWFPAGTDSIPLGTSALFDESGVLTPLGEFYRDA